MSPDTKRRLVVYALAFLAGVSVVAALLYAGHPTLTTTEYFFDAQELAAIAAANGNIAVLAKPNSNILPTSGQQAVSLPYRLEAEFVGNVLPSVDMDGYSNECGRKADTVERVVPCPAVGPAYAQQWLVGMNPSLAPTPLKPDEYDPLNAVDVVTGPGDSFTTNAPDLATLFKPIPAPNPALYTTTGTPTRVAGGPSGGGGASSSVVTANR